MNRRFIGVVVIMAFSPTIVPAQERHHCEWLLDKGIYDTESVSFDHHSFELFKSLLKRSNAGSIKQFSEDLKNIGIGLPIPDLGVLGIKFGGHDATKEFKEWRQAFLNTSYHELASNQKLTVEIKRVSPTLMAAVKHCIDHPPQGKLIAWLTPSRDTLVWSVSAKYAPTGEGDECVIRSFSFTGTTGNAIVSISNKEQESLFKVGEKIDAAERSIVLKRGDTKHGAVITINTTRGKATLEIPATTTPGPLQMIGDLQRRIKDLEDNVKKLQQSTPVVAGANIEFKTYENVPSIAGEGTRARGWPLPGGVPNHQVELPGDYGKRVVAVWHAVIDGAPPLGGPFRINDEIRGNKVIVHFDTPTAPKGQYAQIRVVWYVLFEK